MSNDLRITLLVLSVALWAAACVLAFSRHVSRGERRSRRRF